MGHWVTNDEGEHIYISDGGKVLATRSAISKASGGTERGKALAGRSKAAIGRVGAKPKPTGTGDGPVKAGPQALRDMYAAQARHKSLQGKLDAGDKGVTKEHVAQAREDLKQSRVELLRTKLHQEKQQVEQTARAATPGAAKAAGRGTPERAGRAAEIVAKRNAAKLEPNSPYNNRLFNQQIAARQAATNAKSSATRAVVNERAKEEGKSYSEARAGFYRKPSVIAAERATSQAKPATATTPKGASAYLKEKINFGGEMKPRGEVMATMQKEGHSQANISRYMQGADRAATSQPKPAATPAPARPSLREQAAAARAGKGTAEERIGKLGARADERLRAVGTKSLLLGGQADKARALHSANARSIDGKSLAAKKAVETLAGRTKSLRLAKDIAARLSTLPKGSEQYNQAVAKLAGVRIKAGKLVPR